MLAPLLAKARRSATTIVKRGPFRGRDEYDDIDDEEVLTVVALYLFSHLDRE